MAPFINIPISANIALHAMIVIAHHHPASVQQTTIVKTFSFSKDHLAKVMQQLRVKKLVRSHRGPSGGFTLIKHPKEISVMEVIEAIVGQHEEFLCPFGLSKCKQQSCSFADQLAQVEAQIAHLMTSMNLEAMAHKLLG